MIIKVYKGERCQQGFWMYFWKYSPKDHSNYFLSHSFCLSAVLFAFHHLMTLWERRHCDSYQGSVRVPNPAQKWGGGGILTTESIWKIICAAVVSLLLHFLYAGFIPTEKHQECTWREVANLCILGALSLAEIGLGQSWNTYSPSNWWVKNFEFQIWIHMLMDCDMLTSMFWMVQMGLLCFW